MTEPTHIPRAHRGTLPRALAGPFTAAHSRRRIHGAFTRRIHDARSRRTLAAARSLADTRSWGPFGRRKRRRTLFRVSPFRAPWTPFFENLPPDYGEPPEAYAEPDPPLVRLANLILIRMIRMGHGLRLTPDTPRDRAVFFAEGRVLARENPAAGMVASLITRFREMSALHRVPPAVGRIFLRLGPDEPVVCVVHACLTQSSGPSSGPSERLVVSHLRGMTCTDPSPDEVPVVRKLDRLLEEGRANDDVAKLARVRDEAGSSSRARARVAYDATMAMGHLAEGDEARRCYEHALALAQLTDTWNVAAALHCLGGCRAEAGESLLDSVLPLFVHLETSFGPHEPTTLGWKCEVIEQLSQHDPELARSLWSDLRDPFIAAFGEDDVSVAQLDAV